jgi:hypothetical protein
MSGEAFLLLILNSTYGEFYEKETDLYFDAVNESDSSMTTAADAIKIIIEDPLFSVLEEDSNKTRPTG